MERARSASQLSKPSRQRARSASQLSKHAIGEREAQAISPSTPSASAKRKPPFPHRSPCPDPTHPNPPVGVHGRVRATARRPPAQATRAPWPSPGDCHARPSTARSASTGPPEHIGSAQNQLSEARKEESEEKTCAAGVRLSRPRHAAAARPAKGSAVSPRPPSKAAHPPAPPSAANKTAARARHPAPRRRRPCPTRRAPAPA